MQMVFCHVFWIVREYVPARNWQLWGDEEDDSHRRLELLLDPVLKESCLEVQHMGNGGAFKAEVGRAFANDAWQMKALLPDMRLLTLLPNLQRPLFHSPVKVIRRAVARARFRNDMNFLEVESGFGELDIGSQRRDFGFYWYEST